MTNTNYNIILADPPWKYGSKQLYGDKTTGNKNGKRKRFSKLEEKYATMDISEIKSISVNNITSDDCACFMWVTDSHLKYGIEVLESWGFSYKTVAFVWLKKYLTGTRVYNFAPWTLKSTELCLLGTKGRMSKYKKNNCVKALVEAERTIHSKKPNEVKKRIVELFGNIPKIELFAREKTAGWDVWGNEIKNDINI